MDVRCYVPVSSDDPDWTREALRPGEWSPGKRLLRSIRDYQQARDPRARLALRGLRRRLATLRHRFWSVVSGADIPLNCRLGGGLLLPHPNGIVIHPGAVIGPNCLIFQQVTIGTRGTPAAPVLQGHVDVGAGARILGGVRLGAHAKVGANSVVIHDVPEGATAVGIPAVVKERRS